MDLDSIISPSPYFQDLWLYCSFSILFLISFLILKKKLGINVAIFVSFIKTIIPLIYFSIYVDNTWHNNGDDQMYMSAGILMYDVLSNLFNLNISYLDFNFPYDQSYYFVKELKEQSIDLDFLERFYLTIDYFSNNSFFFKSIHWVAFFSFIFFGFNWYAIIILNIILNIISSIYIYKFSRKFNYSKYYAKFLMIFFLLNLEILSWTSFMSLKESLALLVNIVIFYYFYKVFKKFSIKDLSVLLILILFTYTIRTYLTGFYLIYFIFIYSLLYYNFKFILKNYNYILFLSIPILIVIYQFTPGYTIYADYFFGYYFVFHIPFYEIITLHYDLIDFVKSFFSFWLGPKPWSVDLNNNFLFISAIVHYLLVIPALVGSYQISKRNNYFLVMIIFLIIMSLIYSYVGFENRHRFQFSFIYIWAQSHFIYYIVIKNFYLRKILFQN